MTVNQWFIPYVDLMPRSRDQWFALFYERAPHPSDVLWLTREEYEELCRFKGREFNRPVEYYLPAIDEGLTICGRAVEIRG